MYLGYNAGANGACYLAGPGLLETGALCVGGSGTASFVQSGGTVNGNLGGSLTLGGGSTSSGSYSLSGSGLLSDYWFETIGASGTGTFTQSGGTNSYSGGPNNQGFLSVGSMTGSVGNYNLSGSGLLSGFSEYVGNLGTSAFNQSGGTNSSVCLYVGNDFVNVPNSPGGTYNLSGSGLLSCALRMRRLFWRGDLHAVRRDKQLGQQRVPYSRLRVHRQLYPQWLGTVDRRW